MPDSDIRFRVSQPGAEKTAQDFKKVDDSIDDMGEGSLRATEGIGDLGVIGRQVGTSLASSTGLGGGISRIIGSLMGGGGLIFALGAVTIGLVSMVEQAQGGGFALDDYVKKLENMKSEAELSADAMTKLKEAMDELTNEQMISRIQILRGEVSKISVWSQMAFGFGKQGYLENKLMLEQLIKALTDKSIMTIYGEDLSYVQDIKQKIKYQTYLRDEVAKTQEEVFAHNKEIKRLNGLLKEQTEETKKTTKSTSEYAKALNEVYKELIKVLSAAPPPRGDYRFRGLVTGVPVPEKPKIEFSAEEEEYFSRVNDMAYITAGVLRDEFTKAWQDVFGEANSLFESFAQRISQYFIDLALRYVALNLFSAITGVPTNVINYGGNAQGATSPPSNPSYNIVLDGEIVGKFVDNRVPFSVSKATRLSIL